MSSSALSFCFYSDMSVYADFIEILSGVLGVVLPSVSSSLVSGSLALAFLPKMFPSFLEENIVDLINLF